LYLSIGDFLISTSCSFPTPLLSFDEATAKFLLKDIQNNSTAKSDIALTVHWGELPVQTSGNTLFDSGKNWILQENDDRRILKLRTPGQDDTTYSLVSIFNSDFSSGDIYFREIQPPPDAIYPLIYPVDELLLLHNIVKTGGLLVHACGIALDRGGIIFAGHSQAGKSTVARIWRENAQGDILSDDRIILRLKDGNPWIYGTPWHGEEEFCRNLSTPLKGIFHLEKSSRNSLRKLSPAGHAARILSIAFATYWDAEGLHKTLSCIDNIVHRVPGYILEFTQDPEFIPLVRGVVD
jgi:hypothetical protein